MSRLGLKRGSPGRALGISALLLIAVLGSAATAQASPASLPATVTGYVKTTGGVGIPNVYIQISGETSAATPWDPWNTSFAQEATTDATGRYVITDVIQGTYQMYVNDPADTRHLPAYSEAMPWQDDGVDPSSLQLITGGTTLNVPDIKLAATGKIHGRAMDGGTPIAGTDVVADVTTGGVQFERWITTGTDGRYAIDDATPGDWTVAISGKDRELPADAIPAQHSWDNGAVTEVDTDPFPVGSGVTVNLPDTAFTLGQKLRVDAVETTASNTYWLPDVSVIAALATDPDGHTYYMTTGENGDAEAYLPAGAYQVKLQDDMWLVYGEKTIPTTVTLSPSPTQHFEVAAMPPAPGTYAVHGKVTEAGTGHDIASWVAASYVDPSSAYAQPFRRVPSNGIGNSLYLIRLPKSTGYPGHKMQLEFSDQASPPDVPYVHVSKSVTVAGPGDTLINPALSIGGSISGTIHDEAGNLVPGCLVSVARKALDPELGVIAWVGAENWYTRTDIDGNYTIGGLPANTDFKVNVVADYNPVPGWLLPIKYKDYYRRTYKNQPLVDSLNSSATPIGGVVDHTPVTVTLGHDTGSIDETITPGGYVSLHADGPAYPTGAVWCDVMYLYKGQWFEIDSGYTTGGLFQKAWKVLPVGDYRLNYNDYFGRGGGTWTFSLAPNEHKYASVIVPAPITMSIPSGLFGGSFAGILGGGSGLQYGGVGNLGIGAATGSIPSTAPPLPSGYLSLPTTVLDVTSTGTANGVWTLTLPYDPAVPDGDVPYLRVIHYKHDGTTEILSPIGWNTLKHTIMVQTTSLSPFRVVFKKHTVKLGTPIASNKWKHGKTYTVYGSLSPKHTSGVKSVKLLVYRKNSHGHYLIYKSVWAPNYTYHGATRYRAKFSLKAGSYRIYANAVADKWHLATKTRSYKSIRVK